MSSPETYRLALEIVMGIIGFFAISTLNSIRQSIDDAKKSIDELNIKMAHIIEKTAFHEKTIISHDQRLRGLENKRGNENGQ
jgi:uncharacterized protein YoxC